MAPAEYGEDYVDLANPAVQEAPPLLSSRAGLVVPFDMPDAKVHQPSVVPGTQTRSDNVATASPDIDFDEFGGWLV